MLSDTAEYALRAVLYIAQHDRDGPVSAESVAEALSVPRNYLSKTLHVLAKQGILTSTRGPKGGFRLQEDPETLTLFPIVAPFDRMQPKRVCLLGRPQCSDANPCPAHHQWKAIAEQVAGFFRDTTVAELLRGNGGEIEIPSAAGL